MLLQRQIWLPMRLNWEIFYKQLKSLQRKCLNQITKSIEDIFGKKHDYRGLRAPNFGYIQVHGSHHYFETSPSLKTLDQSKPSYTWIFLVKGGIN